jgi:DNA-binding NarL/FixJ family response regulator
VLILDISLPDVSGVDVLKRSLAKNPQMRVIMLSAYPEKQYATRCLRAGALSYITKDAAPIELITALHRAAEGRRYVSSALTDQMADMLTDDASRLPHEELSDREFEILCLMGKGSTVPQIANLLSISAPTVYTYRSRIYFKMGLSSTPELVRYVLEHHLVVLK